MSLSPEFFKDSVVAVARKLVGVRLFIDGVGGTIIETEAYARDDAASHSFRGETARNASMFGAPGTIYVYRSYGIHWCVNVVCQPGNAVLIRALEPERGLETMRQRRNHISDRRLCAGPGCLTQALGIDLAFDGLTLPHPRLTLEAGHGQLEIVSGPRIGITKAVDHPWRFGQSGSPYLSKSFKK